MSSFKKVVFLFIIYLTISVISSCCYCDTHTTGFYTNTGIVTYNIDNSGAGLAISVTDTILSTTYGIMLKINRQQTAEAIAPPISLIPKAYATCKCRPDYEMTSSELIDSIQIITLSSFNATHLAGSDITSYFSIFRNHTYTPINEFVANYSPTYYSDEEFNEHLLALLMYAPDQSSIVEFEVNVFLSDGRLLKSKTKAYLK